jgi:hypothetical protein
VQVFHLREENLHCRSCDDTLPSADAETIAESQCSETLVAEKELLKFINVDMTNIHSNQAHEYLREETKLDVESKSTVKENGTQPRHISELTNELGRVQANSEAKEATIACQNLASARSYQDWLARQKVAKAEK